MKEEEELKAIREAIDRIDMHLLDLLNRRMKLALEAGRIKAARGLALYDSHREEDIHERLLKANAGPLAGTSLRAIYREILAASRLAQEKNGPKPVGAGNGQPGIPIPRE